MKFTLILKILGLVSVLGPTSACEKHEKRERPLDVTQKLLKTKHGEFQNLDGYSLKLTTDKKMIFIKKFVSARMLYNLSQIAANETPKDIYCQLEHQFSVVHISEISYKALSETSYNQSFLQFLDPNKPIYIFNGSSEKKTFTVFEDPSYANLSKKANLENNCEKDESEIAYLMAPFTAQYLDENTLSIFFTNPPPNNYAMENSSNFFKSLEPNLYSSGEFIQNFKSFGTRDGQIYTPAQSNRYGSLAYSSDLKTFNITVPNTDYSHSVINNFCTYRMTIEYKNFYKKDFTSTALQILRSRLHMNYLEGKINFMDISRIRIEYQDASPANRDCLVEKMEFKDIETNTSKYIFGMAFKNGQIGTFFIFSEEKLDTLLQVQTFMGAD
ncbi:MAG: hypothetical protein JNL11_20550 [Bdellovibrionaceae bacterium]|nr:hypothetical protein [Pseudobdellovibrionaceae bacterium]